MGSPLFRWLAGLDADRLAEILIRRPDAVTPPPRDLPTLARRLQERDSVTLGFYGLPLPAIQVVELMRSLGGPTVPLDQLARTLGRTTEDPDLRATLRLLTQHAFVWPDPDSGTLHLAGPLWPVRPYSQRLGPPPVPGGGPQGPQWQPRFDPHPPQPALAAAPPAAVARESASAAGSAVQRVAALLAACSATPVAVVKSGGVGVRELRKLAKAAGCGELEVRLSLELAHAAGLVAMVRGQGLATEGYDRWRAGEPADQLVVLLRAWCQLRAAPLTPGVTDGPPPPAALLRDPAGPFAHHLRPRVLKAADGLPEGQGATGAESIEDILVWQSPMLVGAMPARSALVAGLWQEAGLVGAVAHGTLTPLGRALLHETGDHSVDQSSLACESIARGSLARGSLDQSSSVHDCPGDLQRVARQLLPTAVRTAMFQADLTAVVPGTPTADLADLLDAVADRESIGGAATWRFSPASVRRALDTGQDAAAILALLRESAAGGALPQPLEYLVGDVARQHGSVRVRAAGCVLHAQDPALTTEIAAARSLSSLGLAAVAPTVLVSAKPVAETLAALRSAGYAPVRESADGIVCVERLPTCRAPTQRRRSAVLVSSPRAGGNGAQQSAEDSSMDALALAVRLLASRASDSGGTYCPEGLDGLDGLEDDGLSLAALSHDEADEMVSDIMRYAGHLTDNELEQLATALAFCTPIRISYTNADGVASVRVIEPIDLDGGRLVAWCHLRDNEQVFILDRIAAVAPA